MRIEDLNRVLSTDVLKVLLSAYEVFVRNADDLKMNPDSLSDFMKVIKAYVDKYGEELT